MVYDHTQDDDEQAFVDAANRVHGVVDDLDSDLAFVSCGAVMLDMLDHMLSTAEDPAYPLMLANQVHAEFLTLMTLHGYDLSDNSVQ